jgi:hypothetical protein
VYRVELLSMMKTVQVPKDKVKEKAAPAVYVAGCSLALAPSASPHIACGVCGGGDLCGSSSRAPISYTAQTPLLGGRTPAHWSSEELSSRTPAYGSAFPPPLPCAFLLAGSSFPACPSLCCALRRAVRCGGDVM